MIDLRALAAAAAGAAIAAAPAYFLGRSHGADSAARAGLEASVQADNSRRQTDAEISSRAAADLCRSFGLRPEGLAECLRRVGEAVAAAGDGGGDHHR